MNSGLFSGFAQLEPAYILLDEQYPTGTVVRWDNLPYEDYREFRWTWMARSDDSGTGGFELRLTVNDDSSSSYYRQNMTASATTLAGSEAVPAAYGFFAEIPGDGAPEGYYGVGEMYVLFPAEPQQVKTFISDSYRAIGTSTGNLKINQTAITHAVSGGTIINSVQFTLATGNFMGKTRFTMYGVR